MGADAVSDRIEVIVPRQPSPRQRTKFFERDKVNRKGPEGMIMGTAVCSERYLADFGLLS